MAIEKDILVTVIVGAVYAFRTKLERTVANTPMGRYNLSASGVHLFHMNNEYVRNHRKYIELSERVINQWEAK